MGVWDSVADRLEELQAFGNAELVFIASEE